MCLDMCQWITRTPGEDIGVLHKNPGESPEGKNPFAEEELIYTLGGPKLDSQRVRAQEKNPSMRSTRSKEGNRSER